MPSLKEIKGRIASVNSTRKITSAMKSEHVALRDDAGTHPQVVLGG